MIFGVFDKKGEAGIERDGLEAMVRAAARLSSAIVYLSGGIALGQLVPLEDEKERTKPISFRKPATPVCAVWSGELFNADRLAAGLNGELEHSPDVLDDAALVRALYTKEGPDGVRRLNGHFGIGILDAARGDVLLFRDRLGVEALYYHDGPRFFVFASQLRVLLAHPSVPRALDPAAVGRFLAFGYNPSLETIFQSARKVKPGTCLSAGRQGLKETRYWRPTFREEAARSEEETAEALVDLLEDAIRLRQRKANGLGVFLSGGMDSSSVAGILRRVTNRRFHTFSYRCPEKQADESSYARIMARFCGSEHHEIVLGPSDIPRIGEVVERMEEPFSNIAVNLTTYVLGCEARDKVTHIMTGDGGDELFGGHPVYCADLAAQRLGWLPPPVWHGFERLARLLPDSDRKLDLRVKIKRFVEGMGLPRDLGSHRWRVYFDGDRLRSVLAPELVRSIDDLSRVFGSVAAWRAEAEAADWLSRSLYADLFTEVDFACRRLALLRAWGIRALFPLLDHRLVEFAATIPLHLKIRGPKDLKYIERRAMECELPHAIVYRKDKMGYAVPFKAWLRNVPEVKAYLKDVLAPERLKRRGLVDPKYVERLWREHETRRENHSHRLWALAVLELWLDAHAT